MPMARFPPTRTYDINVSEVVPSSHPACSQQKCQEQKGKKASCCLSHAVQTCKALDKPASQEPASRSDHWVAVGVRLPGTLGRAATPFRLKLVVASYQEPNYKYVCLLRPFHQRAQKPM